MNDLISREGYKKVIDEQLRFYDPDLSPWHVKILELQRELLDSMPAVGAVPVVRCKDCKYYNTTGCSAGFGWCEDNVVNTGTWDDFYCARGERRENE